MVKYHYRECGLENIFLLNGFTIHKTPYGKSVTISNLRGLHAAIGADLLRKPDVLDALEWKFLRKEMGLSQKLLADTIGVAEITVRKWESGSAKISGPADRLLRVLYKEWLDPKSLARELVDSLSQMDAQVRKATSKRWFQLAEDANDWNRNMPPLSQMPTNPRSPRPSAR